MRELLETLQCHKQFQDLDTLLASGTDGFVEGVWGSSAAYLVAALAERSTRTFVCLLPQVDLADEFCEDLSLFSPGLALPFPQRESLDEESLPDPEIRSQRLAVLKDLALRRAAPDQAPAHRVIVAPVQAALQATPPQSMLEENTLTLHRGAQRPPTEIAAWLLERGFQEMRRVEVPGEFSRRGGILDVFPYVSDAPIRIEFFGDEIESIRRFNPSTQAGTSEETEATITALPQWASRTRRHVQETTLFDHLTEDAVIVLREPAEILSRAEGFVEQEAEFEKSLLTPPALQRALTRHQQLHMAALPGTLSGKPMTLRVHSIERFRGDMESTLKELELVVSDRSRTIMLCNNAGERQRLTELLEGSRVLTDPRFEIRLGRLNQGFDWPDLSLALLTHHEMFHRYRQRRVAPRFRHTRDIDSFYELSPGDLVVHASHGIGRYRKMEVISRDGEREENLCIEYAEKSYLYVPVTRIELVQKYIGPSEHRPRLSKLGTQTWSRRKERAERAVRDLASELLRLQATRQTVEGIVHPADNVWQREFENAFPYEETEDQLRVAEEVKTDMEHPKPTDRLICGDVGYGKTEIAMRAAFKAVMGGRQAAVLVPTTILAEQHMRTFSERMADYPVRIEMLSRFVTRKRQAEIVEAVADGRVDIVIGTHRLLQRDVRFRDLGLVIIDEEQRFGVRHKERLKKLRAVVDVLTLTATPIPRTLHMSLVGLRDISSLNTPIRDRLAINTRLLRHDPQRIRQAVLHELGRDGQVFFLHNRVETIATVAQRLRDLLPEATVVVGHGQMPERKLAEVMRRFVEGRADVLVCTTIIESGLDIPNANTIIIDMADMFGLAELHQLRGRVGRYKHRAYAYLLLPTGRPVTPTAEKRLKAIEEFAELGAGFRIAMRDLEIRGAGNILGPEQSGHLAAVGYDMYCRLLERAVCEHKNEPAPEAAEVSIRLGSDALLPEDYVPDPTQRIDLYRKVHRARNPSDLEALRSEIRDRFGPLPKEVEHLLTETQLRQLAQQAGIESIQRREEPSAPNYPITIQADNAARLIAVLSATNQVYRIIDDTTLHLRVGSQAGEGQPGKKRRFSGEFLVSFLIDILERGLAALPDD